jgi:hypothetical protein
MKISAKSRKNRRRKKLVTSVKPPSDYPWRVLGWLADDLGQYLNNDERWLIGWIVRNRDLESYLALDEVWGLQSITPADTDLVAIRVRYLLSNVLAKFRFPTEKEARVANAKQKFLSAEAACTDFNTFGYKKLVSEEEDWAIDAFTYARSFLSKLLGETLPAASVMTERSRHGPGASLDTVRGFCSSYHKFAQWPYTCTDAAFRYARFVIETDQRWFGALQDSYRERFEIPKHLPLDMRVFWNDVVHIVDGNRITFVPKNALTERSIAIEPTLNLFLQLGVDGYIRRRLKRWGVDLDHQEKNQELARRGSIDQSFVTIDLSSASDTVALKLCKILLPDCWYRYLCDLRSPSGSFDKQTSMIYQKVSSMGCGYTFALESAIFTSIIFGVLKALKGSVNQSDFAIFGDDLIVPKEVCEEVITLLGHCGFRVNTKKSFLKGFVRESCGTDWFHGKPLRPVFLEDTPTSVMELFNDVNRLKRVLSLRFGLEESKTVNLISRWIPEYCRDIIGPLSDQQFDSHIHSSDCKNGRYKNCMWEYQRLVVQPLKFRGNKFLFRKLMHDLRGKKDEILFLESHLSIRKRIDALFGLETEPIEKWVRFVGVGSRFTVTKRNALTVGKTSSTALYWQSEYSEQYQD